MKYNVEVIEPEFSEIYGKNEHELEEYVKEHKEILKEISGKLNGRRYDSIEEAKREIDTFNDEYGIRIVDEFEYYRKRGIDGLVMEKIKKLPAKIEKLDIIFFDQEEWKWPETLVIGKLYAK